MTRTQFISTFILQNYAHQNYTGMEKLLNDAKIAADAIYGKDN